jgi:hypothetical protein
LFNNQAGAFVVFYPKYQVQVTITKFFAAKLAMITKQLAVLVGKTHSIVRAKGAVVCHLGIPLLVLKIAGLHNRKPDRRLQRQTGISYEKLNRTEPEN